MAIPVGSILNFLPGAGITNLPDATGLQDPVTLAQLRNAVNNTAFKDNVRVKATGNVNLNTPGATGDGITFSNGDRYLLGDQTSQPQNGIYIWTGPTTALVRAPDASTFDSLESAVVRVDEGTTNGQTRWRQTQVNGVIDVNNIIWIDDSSVAPPASETTPGIAEIATPTETDTGTDDQRIVTPAKLRNSIYARRTTTQTIGDASATTFSITHNYGTFDVDVTVRENTGARRKIIVETDTPDNNTARVLFASAPASNAYRVTVSRL